VRDIHSVARAGAQLIFAIWQVEAKRPVISRYAGGNGALLFAVTQRRREWIGVLSPVNLQENIGLGFIGSSDQSLCIADWIVPEIYVNFLVSAPPCGCIQRRGLASLRARCQRRNER
jgi:hypothetical protein